MTSYNVDWAANHWSLEVIVFLHKITYDGQVLVSLYLCALHSDKLKAPLGLFFDNSSLRRVKKKDASSENRPTFLHSLKPKFLERLCKARDFSFKFFLIVNETAKMNGTKMVLSVKMHFCSKISMKAYNHQGFHFSRITLPIFRERRLQRRSLCISTKTNETFHEPVHVHQPRKQQLSAKDDGKERWVRLRLAFPWSIALSPWTLAFHALFVRDQNCKINGRKRQTTKRQDRESAFKSACFLNQWIGG